MYGMNEKRNRFVRVAGARTQKVIDMLNLLGNCANTNNYEYDSDDVDDMFSAIAQALKSAKDSFVSELNKSQTKKFTFKK